MDYKCILVRKFIHYFGVWQPRGEIGLSYSLGLWDFIFSRPLCFFPCSRISYLLFFLVLFHSCCSLAHVFGKTLVHEFLICYSQLNDTSFFPIVQLQVHKREFGGRLEQCTSIGWVTIIGMGPSGYHVDITK